MLTMTPPPPPLTYLPTGETYRLRGPTSLVFDGYRGLARGLKRPECNADHSPYQVPRLRMSGAIPLPSLYASMAWRGTTIPLPLPYDYGLLRFSVERVIGLTVRTHARTRYNKN